MPPYTQACRAWKGVNGQADETAIVRLFLDGYSYQEIAERIGVSRNTVSGVLFRLGVRAEQRLPAAQMRAKRRNKAVLAEKRREGASG